MTPSWVARVMYLAGGTPLGSRSTAVAHGGMPTWSKLHVGNVVT